MSATHGMLAGRQWFVLLVWFSLAFCGRTLPQRATWQLGELGSTHQLASRISAQIRLAETPEEADAGPHAGCTPEWLVMRGTRSVTRSRFRRMAADLSEARFALYEAGLYEVIVVTSCAPRLLSRPQPARHLQVPLPVVPVHTHGGMRSPACRPPSPADVPTTGRWVNCAGTADPEGAFCARSSWVYLPLSCHYPAAAAAVGLRGNEPHDTWIALADADDAVGALLLQHAQRDASSVIACSGDRRGAAPCDRWRGPSLRGDFALFRVGGGRESHRENETLRFVPDPSQSAVLVYADRGNASSPLTWRFRGTHWPVPWPAAFDVLSPRGQLAVLLARPQADATETRHNGRDDAQECRLVPSDSPEGNELATCTAAYASMLWRILVTLASSFRTDTPPAQTPRGRFSTDSGEMLAAARAVSRDGAVILAAVTAAFEDFFRNWAHSLGRLGIRHTLLWTTEETLAGRLAAEGYAVHLQRHGAGETGGSGAAALDYNTLPYQRLMAARSLAVLALLEGGIDVLVADTDAVWLSDPFPEHLAQGSGNGTEFDVAGQIDETDTWCRGCLCGGFLYLRSASHRVLDLWRRVARGYEAHVASIQEAGNLSEQLILNQLLASREFADVKVRRLDRLLFPHGRAFFELRSPQSANVTPVVVHNNFVVGAEAKMRRFKSEGLWFISGGDEKLPSGHSGQ